MAANCTLELPLANMEIWQEYRLIVNVGRTRLVEGKMEPGYLNVFQLSGQQQQQQHPRHTSSRETRIPPLSLVKMSSTETAMKDPIRLGVVDWLIPREIITNANIVREQTR